MAWSGMHGERGSGVIGPNLPSPVSSHQLILQVEQETTKIPFRTRVTMTGKMLEADSQHKLYRIECSKGKR
jgi:hypothetical protein